MIKLLIDENVASKVKEGLISRGYLDTKHINDIKKGNSGFIILLSTTSHNGYILYIVSIIKHINNTFINFSI